MLYCTKCKSICEDSTQTCPNCKRSRGLRPVKPEDEVFFLKVSEGEAAELALLFEQNAVRHAIHPVKGGFSISVYDPEYLPTDKDIYVEYQDLERAKELMLKEREEQSLIDKNAQLIQIINAQNETIKSKDSEIRLLRKILADNGIEV